MRKLLIACLVIAFAIITVLPSAASDSASIDAGIGRIESEVEAQLEKIGRAREMADSRMSLARLRVEEQLRVAEEDLAAQAERLEMFREQLQGRIEETDRAVARMTNDWRQSMARAHERIRAQIRETNRLMGRLKELRNRSNAIPNSNDLPPSDRGASASPGSSGGCQACKPASPTPGSAGQGVPTAAELEEELRRIEQERAPGQQPDPVPPTARRPPKKPG